MKSILISLIAGLFFFIGYFVAVYKKENKNLSNFSIGMAFSVLIMLLIFDIFPEIGELMHGTNTFFAFISIFIGFIFFKLIDCVIPHHNHEHEKKHHTHELHLNHIGLITSIALIIHNLIEGIGIYELTKFNAYSGFLMSIGVGLHNLPFGMEITSTMQEKNENNRKIFLTIFVLFISTTIGALSAKLLDISDEFLGVLMCLTVGMILYLLIFELFNEIRKNNEKNYTGLGIVSGIIIMLFTMILGG